MIMLDDLGCDLTIWENNLMQGLVIQLKAYPMFSGLVVDSFSFRSD